MGGDQDSQQEINLSGLIMEAPGAVALFPDAMRGLGSAHLFIEDVGNLEGVVLQELPEVFPDVQLVHHPHLPERLQLPWLGTRHAPAASAALLSPLVPAPTLSLSLAPTIVAGPVCLGTWSTLLFSEYLVGLVLDFGLL